MVEHTHTCIYIYVYVNINASSLRTFVPASEKFKGLTLSLSVQRFGKMQAVYNLIQMKKKYTPKLIPTSLLWLASAPI